MSFLTSFYLYYSTGVDQHAKKSMFYETSPVPYCMALLCYMIHYGTYRGAVVWLRGAAVGVRGATVRVRGAAVGNIGIPTYVISRGAVVRQPFIQYPCFYSTCSTSLQPM